MGFLPTVDDRQRFVAVGDFLNTSDACAQFLCGLTFAPETSVMAVGPDEVVGSRLLSAGRERLRRGRGGRIVSVRFEPLTEAETAALQSLGDLDHVPVACLCRFEGGRQDVVYVTMLDRERTTDLAWALRVGWPLVRRGAIGLIAPERLGEEAMVWAMSHLSSLAALVLRADRTVVAANAVAHRMLEEGRLFRIDRDGRLEAVPPATARPLAEALHRCLGGVETSVTILVEVAATGRQTAAGDLALVGLPVSLTRFQRDGSDTDLAILTVPVPPERARIDRLARLRGLTPTEARIAALLQQGLSNREVAQRTGCSEETAKTYAKRILSKLKVTRSGLAQELTWQAIGGGA